jgi:hypothetical protein
MNTGNLVREFERAGLTLVIVDKPIRFGRSLEDIFQMDIERKLSGTRRYEKFRMYPGHKSNFIQIRDVDRVAKQLVLMVQESAREFDEIVPITKRMTAEMIEERANRIRPRLVRIQFRCNENRVVITHKTQEEVRYFLMGVDERQLFIAQLRGPATTCLIARKSLGQTVEFAGGNRRRGSSLDRQGEWFFLEVLDELPEIELAIKQTRTAIRKKMNIGEVMGRRGSPHVADELVTVPAPKLAHGFSVNSRPRVFVRGSIRHRDHHTVHFQNWREVIANNEGATATASASGVFWVD